MKMLLVGDKYIDPKKVSAIWKNDLDNFTPKGQLMEYIIVVDGRAYNASLEQAKLIAEENQMTFGFQNIITCVIEDDKIKYFCEEEHSLKFFIGNSSMSFKCDQCNLEMVVHNLPVKSSNGIQIMKSFFGDIVVAGLENGKKIICEILEKDFLITNIK